MRLLQIFSVLPVFLFAFTPGFSWSESAAVFFITPILWIPVLTSWGLHKKGVAQSWKKTFDVLWVTYFSSFIVYLGFGPMISSEIAWAIGVTIALIAIATWFTSIVVAIIWRIASFRQLTE